MRLAALPITVLGAAITIAACAEEGRGRDTAGGGRRAARMTTNECGCRDRGGADDPFCEADGTTQLQCLGSAKVCTLACQTNADCTTLFGIASRCNTVENYCTNQ
jgi:hypothetical protein